MSFEFWQFTVHRIDQFSIQSSASSINRGLDRGALCSTQQGSHLQYIVRPGAIQHGDPEILRF